MCSSAWSRAGPRPPSLRGCCLGPGRLSGLRLPSMPEHGHGLTTLAHSLSGTQREREDGHLRHEASEGEAMQADTAAAPSARKRINLALQGGGAHGAFTWGVLDRLLEDGRLEIV